MWSPAKECGRCCLPRVLDDNLVEGEAQDVDDGTRKKLENNKKRRQANSQAQVVFKQVQPG